MEPGRITLRDEHDGKDHRHLAAYLDAEGNLHVDGQDLGPSTAQVSGDGEYEWFKIILATQLPQLIKALGGEPHVGVLDLLKDRYTGAGSYEFERILRESGIPVDLQV